jgi:hypothetical protein
MGDMMVESGHMLMKWKQTEPRGQNDPMSKLIADTMIGSLCLKLLWLPIDIPTTFWMLQPYLREKKKQLRNKINETRDWSLQLWLQWFNDTIEES